MSQVERSTTVGRVLSGLGLLLSSVAAGAALGLLWVRLFVPRKAMGWDGLADFLGGLMVGALVGMVVGILLASRLSLRQRVMAIGIGLLVAVLGFGGLALTAPERREVATESPVAKPFQPFFRVRLRIGHTEEILAAVPPGGRPMRFTEAEVRSSKPELILRGWGPGFERCVTTPSETDLRDLLPLVRQLAVSPEEAYCRTPEDDLTMSINWTVAQERGGRGFDAGCLQDLPAVGALAEAVATVADRLCRAGNGP